MSLARRILNRFAGQYDQRILSGFNYWLGQLQAASNLIWSIEGYPKQQIDYRLKDCSKALLKAEELFRAAIYDSKEKGADLEAIKAELEKEVRGLVKTTAKDLAGLEMAATKYLERIQDLRAKSKLFVEFYDGTEI